MAVMTIMGVVVTQDAAIVARMYVVIDIGEVVPCNLPCGLINPYFPAQLPITALVGNLVGLIKVSDGYPNLRGTGGDSRLCATRAREVVGGNREVFFPDGKACGLVITITVRPLDQLTMPVRDPLRDGMAGLNIEAA